MFDQPKLDLVSPLKSVGNHSSIAKPPLNPNRKRITSIKSQLPQKKLGASQNRNTFGSPSAIELSERDNSVFMESDMSSDLEREGPFVSQFENPFTNLRKSMVRISELLEHKKFYELKFQEEEK